MARAPRVFPKDSSSAEAEERERSERFERWFGYRHNDLELEFALLWGMAEAVELKLLLSAVTEAGLARSERAARRRLEQLQAAMAPDVEALDSPERARAELARRFLAESTLPEPPRFDELNWPKPQHIADADAHSEKPMRLVVTGINGTQWPATPPARRATLTFNVATYEQLPFRGNESLLSLSAQHPGARVDTKAVDYYAAQTRLFPPRRVG